MILVVGATSFIGPAVVEKLLKDGFNLQCLVRTRGNTASLKSIDKKTQIQFCSGNLQSADSIKYSLKDVDCIVYLVDLKKVAFVRNMLAACSKMKVDRAVFISSTTVLVPQKNAAKDLKLESENLIKESGLDWTILRPTMIYGSENDRNYSRMINFIKRRGFFIMFGRGNNLIQPIYIEDVAEAVRLVIKNPKTYKKIYQICGKTAIKYSDMLKTVAEKMGRPFKIIRLPVKLSKAAIKLYSCLFPHSSLKPDMIDRMEIDKAYSYEMASNDFGFLPVSFDMGIEMLINKLKYK